MMNDGLRAGSCLRRECLLGAGGVPHCRLGTPVWGQFGCCIELLQEGLVGFWESCESWLARGWPLTDCIAIRVRGDKALAPLDALVLVAPPVAQHADGDWRAFAAGAHGAAVERLEELPELRVCRLVARAEPVAHSRQLESRVERAPEMRRVVRCVLSGGRALRALGALRDGGWRRLGGRLAPRALHVLLIPGAERDASLAPHNTVSLRV